MMVLNSFYNSAVGIIQSFNYTYINILKYLALLAVIVMIGFLVSEMVRSEQLKKSYKALVNKGTDSLVQGMHTSKIKAFNYEEIDKYINRTGLSYMTNNKITPLGYMVLRISMAIFFMIVGLQYNILAGLILLPIGYMGLDFIINISDKTDNDKMLSDIKNIYDTLRIQTKAGVYITSVLTECYLVAHNKRLKAALLKLTSDIIAKNDINTALDEFKGKFNNEYIDTLVVIIKQSMQTGQASKMFEDIRNQIKDIDAAMAVAEKARINNKTIIVQLFVYCCIIVVAVYITFVALSSGLSM